MPLALLMVQPFPGHAQQDSSCTYEQCALKVKVGFLGRTIAEGVQEAPVVRIRFFAPRVDLFAERSDSAAYYYEAFRKNTNISSWLMLGGLVAAGGSLLVRGQSEEAALALLAVTFGSWTVGIVKLAPTHNDLARAVWWYNMGLP